MYSSVADKDSQLLFSLIEVEEFPSEMSLSLSHGGT